MDSFVSLTGSVIFLNIFPYRFVRPQIARFMGPTRGPRVSCRPLLSPMYPGQSARGRGFSLLSLRGRSESLVTQAPLWQPIRPWGGYLLSDLSTDQVAVDFISLYLCHPGYQGWIYVFYRCIRRTVAEFWSCDNFRITFRICFIIVRINGPDLLIIWFPS